MRTAAEGHRHRSVVRNFRKHFYISYGGVGVAAPGVGVAVFPCGTLVRSIVPLFEIAKNNFYPLYRSVRIAKIDTF